MKIRVKRAYGTPWSKLIGEGAAIGREELEVLGKIMVESIVAEARKDFVKNQQGRRTPRGQPEGLPGPPGFPGHTAPVSPTFFDSFDYEIVGQSTVAITSSWPWIEQLLDGRRPFKMEWLTQENLGGPLRPETGAERRRRRNKGQKRYPRLVVIPIVSHTGQIIFRPAPFSSQDAWVHPGFARHTFIQRGIRKGRKKAAQEVAKMVAKKLAEGNPFR